MLLIILKTHETKKLQLLFSLKNNTNTYVSESFSIGTLMVYLVFEKYCFLRSKSPFPKRLLPSNSDLRCSETHLPINVLHKLKTQNYILLSLDSCSTLTGNVSEHLKHQNFVKILFTSFSCNETKSLMGSKLNISGVQKKHFLSVLKYS